MHLISTLADWCDAKRTGNSKNSEITELAIDSRRINDAESTLFIALKTMRRDGHDFISDAYKKGVRAFLVERDPDVKQYPEAMFLGVDNTLAALQKIAAGHRALFHIPVIGITGSNGKTVVKEWLGAALSEDMNVLRSPKSYNSQVGVPLSVWLLEGTNQLAIFEAGISEPGEMEQLEKVIQPGIGIFTNIGEAHSEGFKDEKEKVEEKLRLFRHAQVLIYCSDYRMLDDCVLQFRNGLKASTGKGLKLFTWSQKTNADLRITSVNRQKKNTVITAHLAAGSQGTIAEGKISITIPFTDAASIENAIHCWCAMLLLGIPQARIAKQLLKLQPVAMRLELKNGSNNCSIINDTYNSDLTSLYLALDYLAQQSQHRQHTVILSDMYGTGRPEAGLYEEVAESLARRGIQRFIGIGAALQKHQSSFAKNEKLSCTFFSSTQDFLKSFHLLSFADEAILIKGARAFEFEQISALLEEEVHQTVLSINLSALINNLNVFRSRIKPGVKIMAMVKAFSYGAGSYEIAHALQFAGIDYFAVAYADEGVALRKAGITAPIMVMSPDAVAHDRMIAWKLEPEIFSLRSLEAFASTARRMDADHYPIHIKIDTGMHRLGFAEHELEELISALRALPAVKVQSIFSHLAAAEDAAEDAFTMHQSIVFERACTLIENALGYKPIRHLANSSGIARHPQLHYGMVRLGLGLYGIESSGVMQESLQQVGSLSTTIAQIKEIPAGETIGYNRAGGGFEAMRIATISIGYADGYPRGLGKGIGYVLIHGQPAALVGVICMDMCMVDITGIEGVQEGDTAVIFSADLPISKLAKWAGTIPYELMTGISQRVKRVYVNET